jgi:hypothetical protein
MQEMNMNDLPNFFEVSPAWMKACGKADKPNTLPIQRIDHYQGRHTFVTVLEDGQYPWVVWSIRGRFV